MYEVSVRVGYGMTAGTRALSGGNDSRRPVLRWQMEALSARSRWRSRPLTPATWVMNGGRAMSFPNAPKIVKGGIVVIDPATSAVLRVIVLQYNPDTLSRTLQVRAFCG